MAFKIESGANRKIMLRARGFLYDELSLIADGNFESQQCCARQLESKPSRFAGISCESSQ